MSNKPPSFRPQRRSPAWTFPPSPCSLRQGAFVSTDRRPSPSVRTHAPPPRGLPVYVRKDGPGFRSLPGSPRTAIEGHPDNVSGFPVGERPTGTPKAFRRACVLFHGAGQRRQKRAERGLSLPLRQIENLVKLLDGIPTLRLHDHIKQIYFLTS